MFIRLIAFSFVFALPQVFASSTPGRWLSGSDVVTGTGDDEDLHAARAQCYLNANLDLRQDCLQQGGVPTSRIIRGPSYAQWSPDGFEIECETKMFCQGLR